MSDRAIKRVKSWSFGSDAYNLEHRYNDPLKDASLWFRCSKEFEKRITDGTLLKNNA